MKINNIANFLEGLGSVFNIFPEYKYSNKTVGEIKTSLTRNVWLDVGKHMRSAIIEFDNEKKGNFTKKSECRNICQRR